MKKILCKIMGLAFFPAALFFTACPPPPVERFEFPASAQRWYYVSSAGSDANSGLTEDAPFKTFAHAAQAAAMDPKSLRVFILDMLDAASEGTLNSSETFLLDGALVRREITISGRKTAGFSGSGTEEIVLRVKNEGRVIIQNIALQDGKTGLFLEGASSARMESGNINSNWRGAFIRSGSSFVMTGGVIENNRIPQSNFGATFGGSGGVCIVDVGSSFTMSGTAHIYGNAAHFSEATAVRALEYTHFVMAGNAVISGNFTPGLSPGDCCVGISPWASFSMSGNALIANNHHVDYGVKLGQSSVFAMEGNAKITATTEGGGVYMDTGADARMAGSSSITNNRNNGVSGYAGNPQDRFFTLGGSARIADNGKAGVSAYGIVLLMTDDAVISGNSQSGIRLVDGSLVINANALVTRNRTEADGGGAALSGTPFTLTGNAVISHNYARLRGGGVSARLSEVKTSPAEQPFTLSGNAVICDNTSGENGGGVYLQGTDFIMDGNSSIARNEAKTGSGGAVTIAGSIAINGSAYPGGHFTLRDGSISDNTASLYGGGVIVRRNESSGIRSTLFKMEGGLISGNSAGKGGGIAVQHGTEFEKDTAGYIYGSEASADVRNTASTGSAVWVAANDADDDLVGLEKSVEASRGLSKPYGNWTDP